MGKAPILFFVERLCFAYPENGRTTGLVLGQACLTGDWELHPIFIFMSLHRVLPTRRTDKHRSPSFTHTGYESPNEYNGLTSPAGNIRLTLITVDYPWRNAAETGLNNMYRVGIQNRRLPAKEGSGDIFCKKVSQVLESNLGGSPGLRRSWPPLEETLYCVGEELSSSKYQVYFYWSLPDIPSTGAIGSAYN